MEKYIESETLELKEKYTDNIAKEIVAFLNSSGGKIIIGVKDNGTVIGVNKIDETLRKISDIITTQIEPNPQDEINSTLQFDESKTLIVINISKGKKHIYCQKKYGFSSSGCSIRIGTTCKEMTPEQIRSRYEQKFIDTEYMLKKRASLSNLTFRDLKIYYTENGYHLDDKTFETNLNLRNENGDYNLLGELLADKNNIPFIFAKFVGKNKASMLEKNDYGYGCILTTYEKIKNRLKAENISISNTTVRPRKDIYLFDYNAVNEAILNALVHNDWLISEPQISMFDDRIEIFSHGGLPKGMNKIDFFDGISNPRNSTLMRIFLTMKLTEHTGHGIPTIVEKYGKDVFKIEENYIRCTIPFNEEVLNKKKNIDNLTINIVLNKTESKILELIDKNPNYTFQELSNDIGVTKRTIERNFKSLEDKCIIAKNNSGNWVILK